MERDSFGAAGVPSILNLSTKKYNFIETFIALALFLSLKLYLYSTQYNIRKKTFKFLNFLLEFMGIVTRAIINLTR